MAARLPFTSVRSAAASEGSHNPKTCRLASLIADSNCGDWSFHGDEQFDVAVSGWLSVEGDHRGLAALAQTWARMNSDAIAQCEGDFALVVHDKRQSVIWLARSPISSRPLFFRNSADGDFRLASMASAIAPRAPELDSEALVQWYGGLVGSSVGSMFCGVERVEPGCVVRVEKGRFTRTRYWQADVIPSDPDASDEELARGLRTAFEAAVADRIGEGRIASLLSAGRDSGCVSALAARLLGKQGRRLDCFTACPGADPLFAATDYLLDEWPGATNVAALHSNIDHHAVTPRGITFCSEVEAIYRVHPVPLGNPLSLHWWISAQRMAAEMGCTTLLTGGMGNLTISDGGPIYLADLAAPGSWRAWWSAARDIASFAGASWLNILNISFGGRMPEPAYRAVQRLRGRVLEANVAPFLRGEFRQRLLAEHRRQEQRPPRRSRQRGMELLTAMDIGDVSPDRLFGLTMADPTADRRVVEAALRIPPERLVSRYDRRPIFELAFGDLLPKETIRAPRRAYQSMDWNFAYDLCELRQGLSRYRQRARIADMLDFRAMERALDRWPHDRLATLEETAEFGEGLLRAFALAAFLFVHFPD